MASRYLLHLMTRTVADLELRFAAERQRRACKLRRENFRLAIGAGLFAAVAAMAVAASLKPAKDGSAAGVAALVFSATACAGSLVCAAGAALES